MSGDQVAAQAVAQAQGALQMNAIAGLERAQGRTRQGFGPKVRFKVPRAPGHDGQTGAIDRHAGAQGKRGHVEIRRDRQAARATRSGAQRFNFADCFYDASKQFRLVWLDKPRPADAIWHQSHRLAEGHLRRWHEPQAARA